MMVLLTAQFQSSLFHSFLELALILEFLLKIEFIDAIFSERRMFFVLKIFFIEFGVPGTP